MNKKILIKKGIAVAVIVLFLGMSIPSTGTKDVKQITMPISSGNTLYVGGDGPGNYTRIQDAIDNASDGDTVYVFSGTYYEQIIIEKQIFLIGIGRPTVSSNQSYTILINADGCLLQNLEFRNTIHHYAIKLRSDYNVLQDLLVSLTSRDLDLVDSCNNYINNNSFLGGWKGIILSSSCNNTITNNTVESHVYGEIVLDEGSHNNFVYNNSFSHSDITEGIINAGSSSNNIFLDNFVSSNRHGGIKISSGENLSIIDNKLVDNGLSLGVSIETLSTYTIEGNTINGKPIYVHINKAGLKIPTDAGQVLLYNCTDCIIENLNITEVDPGIKLISCSNNVIRKNKVSSSMGYGSAGYGIIMSNSQNNIISNNTISKYYKQIRITDSDNNAILNNIIGGGGDGIYLWYGLNNTIKDNIILNLDGDGIYVHGSKNTQITQNYVISCDYGIFIDYGSFEVIDNTVQSNKYGISVQDTSQCVIQGNNISYNKDTGLEGRRLKHVKFTENNIMHNKNGIKIYWSGLTLVKRNNFIENDCQAYFFNGVLTRWNKNYWDDHLGFGGKLIRGNLYREFWSGDPWNPIEIQIPWIQVDWFPAKEPYDIGE